MSSLIDALADRDVAEKLSDFEERMDAIKKAHGLDDDAYWPVGEGPAEYEEALRQRDEAWDAYFADNSAFRTSARYGS